MPGTKPSTRPERRRTRQRAQLWEALESEQVRFRTAQEIQSLLQQRGSSVGLTTTYRNLNHFTAEGLLHVTTRPDGEKLFRRCPSSEHHHHLICKSCGKAVDIEDASCEDWIKKVSRRSRFSMSGHQLDLFSTCLECSGVTR